jgi:hypothetical protein
MQRYAAVKPSLGQSDVEQQKKKKKNQILDKKGLQVYTLLYLCIVKDVCKVQILYLILKD